MLNFYKLTSCLIILMSSVQAKEKTWKMDNDSEKSLRKLKGKDCSTLTSCHQCILGSCDWSGSACSGSDKSKIALIDQIFDKGKKCGDPLDLCSRTKNFVEGTIAGSQVKEWRYMFSSNDTTKTIPLGYFCFDTLKKKNDAFVLYFNETKKVEND